MPMYDIIIKNGIIVDGTGAPGYCGDIGICDEKITAIGKVTGDGKTVIDAKGKIVCPGFIDSHSHSDKSAFESEVCDCKIYQGITTEITGNCGTSVLPANTETGTCEKYLAAVDKAGYVSNLGTMIGHGQLRRFVVGEDLRNPTEEEMQKMEDVLRTSMQQGSFGLSFGLIYAPSAYSEYSEILRLAKVVAEYNGVVSVHMRNEGDKVFEAVNEVISIAEESGVKLEISHIKIASRELWGSAEKLLKVIEDAQKRGVRVTCDQYPYCAANTHLKVLVPLEYTDGGAEKMLERLQTPPKELLDNIEANISRRGGGHTVLITTSKSHPEYSAKYLDEIADMLHLSLSETVIRILIDCKLTVYAVFFSMCKDDMIAFMKKSYISLGVDATAKPYSINALYHPRKFGTFPKFFEIVREEELLPIEQAVRKCTGLPAEVFNIENRGTLKTGNYADIVIFDENTIGSKADYKKSNIKPDGIDAVIVNGKIAIQNNLPADWCHGHALIHS